MAASELPPFEHGTRSTVFRLQDGAGRVFSIGPSICYDLCFAENYRRGMAQRPRPDFLVQSGWEPTDRTGGLQHCLLRMAQFRAIECRRALARSVTGGYSTVIDGNRRVHGPLRDPRLGEPLTVRIPVDRRSSLYVRWGDWLPLTGCAVIVGGLVWPLRRRTPNPHARVRNRE